MVEHQKRMEFSKKIYIFNIIFVVCLVIASLVLIALSGRLGLSDLSPLTVICTAGFSELGIFSGFYANKAKAENILKISKQIQSENIDIANIQAANQVMSGNKSDNFQ